MTQQDMPVSTSGKLDDGSRFQEITQQIMSLINPVQPERISEAVEEFKRHNPPEALIYLTKAVDRYVHRDYQGCVNQMMMARELLDPEDYPTIGQLYSRIWINAQLMLPRRSRPAIEAGYANYKANIAALREVDARLTPVVQKSRWPEDLVLVDFWQGLHLFSLNTKDVFMVDEATLPRLDELTKKRVPIAFGGAASGRELLYCLDHQYQGLYGMTRTHYLFEADPARLRAMLHLFDMSDYLRTREVILFGGPDWQQRFEDFFYSLRYVYPSVFIANQPHDRHYFQAFQQPVDFNDFQEHATAYYHSEDFRRRQVDIATGKIQPRILISTCRWTSFLKYCAADFQKAFEKCGCSTRYLIEEDDVQTLLPALFWRELDEFKPDMVFKVSHARPSKNFLPVQLPFVGYIQDKCGPIAELPNLSSAISNQDLFVCMVSEFQRYLREKGVPPDQICNMPVPADEDLFYPLVENTDSIDSKYVADVGFVKHGHAEKETLLKIFLDTFPALPQKTELLKQLFMDLYRYTCLDLDRCYYESDLQDFVFSRLNNILNEAGRNMINYLVRQFYITVYSAAWRCQFLEAIDQAGIDLALYGHNWEKHKRLRHLRRGPVARDRDLNLVYNCNRVNLSINHEISMHQRLAECGLAGGFMMVADHPDERDSEPARNYFAPDKEIVYFRTPDELVEKCRCYLDRPDERRNIAVNFRRRALMERTCEKTALAVLRRWRPLLDRVPERINKEK